MSIEIVPIIGQPEPEPQKYLPFEVQLKRKLPMEVGPYKEKGTYIHIRPKNLSSDTPIVIAPGLTENEDMYRQLLHGYYTDGREVYLPRHSKRMLNIDQNGYPREQDQKIEEISTVIDIARTQPDGTQQGKVDLIARSDGGVNAIFAAERDPRKIRNIILEGTKYTDSENAMHLLWKLGEHAAHTGVKEFVIHPHAHMRHGIRVATGYVLDVPKFINEVQALAHSDTKTALVRLGEHGVGRFGLHGTADSIFPNQDLQKDISAVHQGKPGKVLDGFVLVPGRHHESIYRDELYIRKLRQLTQAVEDRSKKYESLKSQRSGPQDL